MQTKSITERITGSRTENRTESRTENRTESRTENRTESRPVGKGIIRRKMPESERAKQFMPFAALRGLEEALAKKDRQYEEKIARETLKAAREEPDRF